MSAGALTVPLLVFEAADCLMAIPAIEIRGSDPLFTKSVNVVAFDLDEYFTRRCTDGPWLRWTRGTRSAWLRVRRVVDVVSVPLTDLTPMPGLLRSQRGTRAFLAAGVNDANVFLLLDPARLG